jgi:16S rRNA (guanine527-N7)-methyltransferase
MVGMNAELSDAVAALSLQLSEGQVDQLAAFRDLLAVSANEFNLTSLRDPESIQRRHILESLAFGVFLDERGLMADAEPSRRLLDVGSGAGLPGIPLKVGWPWLQVTLLESVGKKCRFLELACDRLGLAGIEVAEARAEDFGRDPVRRETYNLVVARALAPLPVLLEYTVPALRVGGTLAAIKGSAAPREVKMARTALDALGGRLAGVFPLAPPQGLPQSVVLVEKVAATPDRYPRRPGIPAKRPL